MKIVKDITVKVTYQVGLHNLGVTNEVYKALKECYENGDTIDLIDHGKLRDWLALNIQEMDCCEWEAEIQEFD